MKPYKNRPKIIKGNNGIKTDDTVATFGLPEVNVYPNNRWGDIARSQGLETARNWRKVKEGTTKGINDFANDPRTQFVLTMLPLPQGLDYINDGVSYIKGLKNNMQLFYHGSPVRFNKFDYRFIGSGEGGSKAMSGINLWYDSPKNAPKFANIQSPDAPLHLGRSSKPIGGTLNPTIYDVIGKNLNLYNSPSNRIKGLLQSNLEALRYDGIRTPSQVTIFPQSINKLRITNKQSIPDFIHNHPEVEKWTPWTTNEEFRKLIEGK